MKGSLLVLGGTLLSVGAVVAYVAWTAAMVPAIDAGDASFLGRLTTWLTVGAAVLLLSGVAAILRAVRP